MPTFEFDIDDTSVPSPASMESSHSEQVCQGVITIIVAGRCACNIANKVSEVLSTDERTRDCKYYINTVEIL